MTTVAKAKLVLSMDQSDEDLQQNPDVHVQAEY